MTITTKMLENYFSQVTEYVFDTYGTLEVLVKYDGLEILLILSGGIANQEALDDLKAILDKLNKGKNWPKYEMKDWYFLNGAFEIPLYQI